MTYIDFLFPWFSLYLYGSCAKIQYFSERSEILYIYIYNIYLDWFLISWYSAFHHSEVDQISTRNYWGVIGETTTKSNTFDWRYFWCFWSCSLMNFNIILFPGLHFIWERMTTETTKDRKRSQMKNCLVFSNEFNFTQSFRQDKKTVTKRTGETRRYERRQGLL